MHTTTTTYHGLHEGRASVLQTAQQKMGGSAAVQ